ncbi:FAD binding domain-containing protein [Candidatus Bipolaricaulota bacterium]
MLGDFEYVRPRTIGDACKLLRDGEGQAVAYAGGTDLLVDIRNSLRSPKLLVDIKGLEGLDCLETRDGEQTILGATVPLNRIVENAALRERLSALSEAALTIATYQLRNRATIGGNLCNASPASDSIPPLLVTNAALHIEGREGSRDVPLHGFCTGVKKTCLKPGELVTEIRIPPLEEGTRTAFLKQQRIRGHDLAVVNLAGSLSPSDGALRIAIGSCGPIPILLDPIETASHTNDAIATEAVRVAEGAISPISDVRASAEYRRAILPVLIRRLIERLLDGTGGA